MSSVKLRNVFVSRTFKRALGAWLVLVVVSCGVLGAYALHIVSAENEALREHIDGRLEELAEMLYEDGLPVVIDEFSDEYGPLWPAEEANHLIEEGDVLFLILERGTCAWICRSVLRCGLRSKFRVARV